MVRDFRGLLLLGMLAVTTTVVPQGEGQTTPPLASEPKPEPGVLYLTDQQLTNNGDTYCPGGTPRYQMTLEPSDVLTEGTAIPASLSTPALVACATRFVFSSTTTFTLTGLANVTLNIQCDPAAVSAPLADRITFRLRVDVNDRGATAPDGAASAVGNANPDPEGASCLDARQPVTKSLDVDGLEINSGGTLTLLVWVWYITPPPGATTVKFLTGGPNPSRIEALGIPSPNATPEPPAPDLRPRLFLASEPTNLTFNSVGSSCAGFQMPVYQMVSEQDPPANGSVALGTSTGLDAGCAVWFDYYTSANMTLSGKISASLWFMCDTPTYGNPSNFVVEFHRAPDGDPLTGAVIAPAAQTGTAGAVAPCPDSPVNLPLAETTLPKPVEFGVGDRFRIRVFPNIWNLPWQEQIAEQLTQGVILVGPATPSFVKVDGLPWNPLQTSQQPSQPENGDSGTSSDTTVGRAKGIPGFGGPGLLLVVLTSASCGQQLRNKKQAV